MMHMSFWWGDDIGDFFIKGFKIDSPGSMTLLCLSLFSLSVAVEGLKVHRTRSRAKAAREKSRSISCSPSENSTLISSGSQTGFRLPFLKEVLDGVKEMSIFVFHNLVNYTLMLSVMMYNGYIFVAVALGAFVGYFLFGHLSMKTNMENLQAIRTKIICSTRCADSEEPCTSTTPIVSHCPTIVGEGSGNGVSVMRSMQKSSSRDSSSSDENIREVTHPCH
jgi:copper transporter 1